MLQNVAGLKSLFVQWVTGNSVCQFMRNLTRVPPFSCLALDLIQMVMIIGTSLAEDTVGI